MLNPNKLLSLSVADVENVFLFAQRLCSLFPVAFVPKLQGLCVVIASFVFPSAVNS